MNQHVENQKKKIFRILRSLIIIIILFESPVFVLCRHNMASIVLILMMDVIFAVSFFFVYKICTERIDILNHTVPISADLVGYLLRYYRFRNQDDHSVWCEWRCDISPIAMAYDHTLYCAVGNYDWGWYTDTCKYGNVPIESLSESEDIGKRVDSFSVHRSGGGKVNIGDKVFVLLVRDVSDKVSMVDRDHIMIGKNKYVCEIYDDAQSPVDVHSIHFFEGAVDCDE